MANEEINEEPIKIQKPFTLFGKELQVIPCFRDSCLNAYKVGFGIGLLSFLLTSRVELSMKIGVHSFGVFGIGYWFYCRYQHAVSEMHAAQLYSSMGKFILKEGTELPEDTSSST